MRTAPIAAVLLLAFATPIVAAEDADRDVRIKAFVERCAEGRKAAIASIPKEIKTQKTFLARGRSGFVDARKRGVYVPDPDDRTTSKERAYFPSKESKLAFLKETQAKIDALIVRESQLKANDPAYIATIDAYDRDLAAGDIGLLTQDGVNVIQVIDGENAIVRRYYLVPGWTVRRFPNGQELPFRSSETHEQILWAKGFPTKGVTDGNGMTIAGCVEVTGTKQYESGAGTNTVVQIEPFDAAAAFSKFAPPAREKSAVPAKPKR